MIRIRTIMQRTLLILAALCALGGSTSAAGNEAGATGKTSTRAMVEPARGLKLELAGTERAYFTHRGRPLLSFGGLSDFIFYATSQDAYDHELWADWAADHGINHVRAYPPLSWKHMEKFYKENGGDLTKLIFPYAETRPGSRQFDLTRFNDAYWRHFRQQLEYLQSKGIIIHLLMWNGWQLRATGEAADYDWGGHFFNPAVNVNAFTDHLGGDVENRFGLYHGVADGKTDLVKAQQAWFEKLVEITADLDNVYYDLVHELAENHRDWPKVQTWIDAMATAVLARSHQLRPEKQVIFGMDTGAQRKGQTMNRLICVAVGIAWIGMAAATWAGEPPYPPSPVIAKLQWDPEPVRLPGKMGPGKIGDNWPITWVDDNLQITSYGDGLGFSNHEPRLSLGFAEVTGDPPSHRAIDFPSDADTPAGFGPNGIKASGLLMVDGVLYMFVRNYRPAGSKDFTNSRLAWSTDRGRHWTWADWHFSDTFGCPDFVQFGKNYEGARDECVYIVSQANDDAYATSPDVVLARVAKAHVRDRGRWEFFAGLKSDGDARWTADVSRQEPIFTDRAAGTERVSMSYDRGVNRYLLTTSHRTPGVDTPHSPALGVFDAPAPWGPWTTVYYDDRWSGDVLTYHHKFPTRWISGDGRKLWLLYSGLGVANYTFCLRRATLSMGAPSVPASKAAPTSFEWQTATPESQGMSSEKLKAMKDALAAHNTKALLVIRNDKIVCEWYAPDHGPKKPHATASLAKALVGGVSLAVAMTDGLITLDDKASKYIPQWKNDPLKSKITIRHLGSHTSGIEDSHGDPSRPHNQQPGWKGEFWRARSQEAPEGRDSFSLSRDEAEVLFEPGTDWAYSNPGIALLTYCVTAAIKDSPRKDIRTLLRDRVMRPIGVPDEEWSVGYGRTIMVDGLPLVGSWGGGSYTARAAARVGRLMLREGDWDGKRLLSQESVRQTTADAGTPGINGMGWWSNHDGRWTRVPKDLYFGAGAEHQVLVVIPSLKLIAVRNGQILENVPAAQYEEPLNTYLFEPLVDAMTAREGNEPTEEPRNNGPAHPQGEI